MSKEDKTILTNSLLEEIATFRADPDERELDLLSATNASDVEAAKEWARHSLRRDMAGGWFLPDGGHRRRVWEMTGWAEDVEVKENPNGGFTLRHFWDEGKIRALIEDADKGDADAHQAVCEIIADYIKTKTPAPSILRGFMLELLSGARSKPAPTRGWDKVASYSRDACIQLVVNHLMYRGGFSRTRNPATDAPSACSIVADVLGELGISLSEKSVAKITTPRRKRPAADDDEF